MLYLTATWIGADAGESDPLPPFDELLRRAGKDGAARSVERRSPTTCT